MPKHKATIEITDDGDDKVGMAITFDPPIDTRDGSSSTLTSNAYHFAISLFEYGASKEFHEGLKATSDTN